MPFDEDPQDSIESYPCECGGVIECDFRELDFCIWECNKCGKVYGKKEDE